MLKTKTNLKQNSRKLKDIKKLKYIVKNFVRFETGVQNFEVENCQLTAKLN
jgi:hypothetical protein